MTNPTWDPAEGTDAEEAVMVRAILPVTSDCVQVFINDLSIVYIANMRSKGEALFALRMFIDDVGISKQMLSDNSWKQTSDAWRKTSVVDVNDLIKYFVFHLKVTHQCPALMQSIASYYASY